MFAVAAATVTFVPHAVGVTAATTDTTVNANATASTAIAVTIATPVADATRPLLLLRVPFGYNDYYRRTWSDAGGYSRTLPFTGGYGQIRAATAGSKRLLPDPSDTGGYGRIQVDSGGLGGHGQMRADTSGYGAVSGHTQLDVISTYRVQEARFQLRGQVER